MSKKKTLLTFNKMKQENAPISWVTAYNYPLAYAAESAGIDMILIGDSGGMVELGYDTTNPVTMDEMIQMAKAVDRATTHTFLVGDMPQGSYEISDEEAVRNALRFVKEAGCDAVKLEGGARVASRIKAIVDAGIVVVGHLGLTPQSSTSFGGYRVQGKTPESFKQIIEDVWAIEKAGISMLLLEAMPAMAGKQIAKEMDFPVLGIGAGNLVDGQLLIMDDMLGLYPDFRPKFAKCYIPQVSKAFMGDFDHPAIQNNLIEFGRDNREDGMGKLAELAIWSYIDEVKNREFPNEDYTYQLTEEEENKLQKFFNSRYIYS